MKCLKCLLLVFALLSPLALSYAQETGACKVLQPELVGDYTGDCKKGLAHGVGEATGTDRYAGSFKNGYPHGKGVYTYSSGAVYIGGFLKGKRHGQGKLTHSNEGEEITQEGLWENDSFIGKKPEPPYSVLLNQNVTRFNITKNFDTREMVAIKIIRNGVAVYPNDLMLVGSTGVLVQQQSFNGFEQVQFPFRCSIKYSLPSAFQTVTINYEFNFIIREPGSWVVTLSQ